MIVWCPKCAKELSKDQCELHGYVVDKIYVCNCGRPEELRAKDNVPQRAHYCEQCAEVLSPDVRDHLERVVAQSSPTRGSWSSA